MCQPVPCPICGKTSWAGCGRHANQVMASVPPSGRCSCGQRTRARQEDLWPLKPSIGGRGVGIIEP
jgi:hypothetical protein